MWGFRISRWALVLVLGVGAARAQVIPTVRGTTFAGAPVDLPADLKGKLCVLVIGFGQGSREAVTVWGKKLAADYYDSPTVLYFEMPVLASVPKLMRGFVMGRIKADVSDRGKVHFVPLEDHEAEWRALVHYTVPDDAYVLLVDGGGVARWQEQGPATDAAFGALKQQVDALRGSGGGAR